jgi:hypothetical protein
MDPRYWTRSVDLALGRQGQVEKVRSTRHAVECLSRWPVQRGNAYTEAIRACRAVLLRGAPRADAREAFVFAALEAGIYIRPRTRKNRTSNA